MRFSEPQLNITWPFREREFGFFVLYICTYLISSVGINIARRIRGEKVKQKFRKSHTRPYMDTCRQIKDNNKQYTQDKTIQEVHGPRVAHLSDIAIADMQMLCNIFPILSSQLMKRSSFKQFFILKKKIYGMPVN